MAQIHTRLSYIYCHSNMSFHIRIFARLQGIKCPWFVYQTIRTTKLLRFLYSTNIYLRTWYIYGTPVLKRLINNFIVKYIFTIIIILKLNLHFLTGTSLKTSGVFSFFTSFSNFNWKPLLSTPIATISYTISGQYNTCHIYSGSTRQVGIKLKSAVGFKLSP